MDHPELATDAEHIGYEARPQQAKYGDGRRGRRKHGNSLPAEIQAHDIPLRQQSPSIAHRGYAHESADAIPEKVHSGEPTLLAEFIPGGGGRPLANHMYRAARPDGLSIGFPPGSFISYALLGEKGIYYDVGKLIFLGSPESTTHYDPEESRHKQYRYRA